MSRNRKLSVLLAWGYPFLFASAAVLLTQPNSGWTALAMLCLGPVVFTALLSYLLFDRQEESVVRLARASRRVGYMCKLSALVVLTTFIPAFHFLALPSPAFHQECVAILWPFFFFSMIGLMLAAIAFRSIDNEKREPGGARDAFIVTAVMVLLAAVLLPPLARSQPTERRPSCFNNLKQLGLICKMFAPEHDGFFPELSAGPGFLSMANTSAGCGGSVMPEYMSDPAVLVCPSCKSGDQLEYVAGREQDLMDASSYVYLGYMVKDAQELETFFDCYKQRIAAGLPFDEDLQAQPGRGTGGGDKILRLRIGAEKVYVKGETNEVEMARAQAAIPVMFDRNPENHIPPGVNVLYLDGHVEFHKYPGEWPATAQTFAMIKAVESQRPQARPQEVLESSSTSAKSD